MRNTGRSGFTLIEMLVVIMIIGILSAMSVTGFSWWGETRAKKTAESQIEALNLALEQYKSDFGGYPRTDDLESSDLEGWARGTLLFQSLTGFVDRYGEKIDAKSRGNVFLPNRETFTLGTLEGGECQEVTLTSEQMKGRQVPEVFLLDPWDNPYVYEFPRPDGHSGFLLFSRGPDGESSVFDSELTQTPKKEEMDEDNSPPAEPGKW